MLEARKNKLFEKIFSVYNRNLLSRRFDSIRVSSFDNLNSLPENFPLIIYANHSSWWDGLIAFRIAETIGLDSYVMMEEKHLSRFFLFRRVGAFSVVRENPREALKSLKYIAKILSEKPARSLWIFPQGEIKPNESRPLFFYNGISKLMEMLGNCAIVPIAFRYEFLQKFKPEAFAEIGEIDFFEACVNSFDRKENTKKLEEKLTVLLDNLKNKISIGNLESFQNIL